MKKNYYLVLAILAVLFMATAYQPVHARCGDDDEEDNVTCNEDSSRTSTASQDQDRDQERTQSTDQIRENSDNAEGDANREQETNQETQRNSDLILPEGNADDANDQLDNFADSLDENESEDVRSGIQQASTTLRQNYASINENLTQVQGRSRFAKFFLGPNYSELKKAQAVLEQNRLMIQNLNTLRAQITNEGDQATLQAIISLLQTQNTMYENEITNETRGFSLFGWLNRLVSKYQS